MSKRLITTALAYKYDSPLFRFLILGAWCECGENNYNNDLYSKLKYHWNDRTKKENDFYYLNKVRDELIILIAKELNNLHDVNFSVRSWRLMIGYWVTQFTSVIYDRWYMVKIASEQDAWLVSHSVDTDWRQLVPQDTSEASKQFIKDLWNDVVIGQLMENWTSIEVVKDNPIEPFNAESFFRNPIGKNMKPPASLQQT